MNRIDCMDEPAAAAGTHWKPLETVRAADLPYRRFLDDYVHANRPVVVTGAITDWPALRKWTPAYFKERFGSKPVAVSYEETMPFDQFIDGVMASDDTHPGSYMFRLFLHENLPEALPDVIPQNVYAFPRRYASPLMRAQWRRPDGYLKLLIGGVGSKFPVLHFDGDNAHAAITEVYGDKEFVMFPPEGGPLLYANPKLPNRSLIDNLHEPDLQRFPLLAKATRYRAVLRPGDMVFVPSRWWYTARPLTSSVSVCMNILDGSNWAGFVNETCADALKQSALKAHVYRVYLTSLGGVLSTMEWLQEHLPRVARALVVPVWIGPASAAFAHEPSARQLKITVPTS
jgi:hypothetical protein